MSQIYTPKQLRARIARLDEHTPIAGMVAPPKAYSSHKEHWQRWLAEYDGPGFYGRSNSDRDARFIWNHVQNVGMILWLPEAAGIAPDLIEGARLRAASAGGNSARQTAAARSVLPWLPLAALLWPKA